MDVEWLNLVYLQKPITKTMKEKIFNLVFEEFKRQYGFELPKDEMTLKRV